MLYMYLIYVFTNLIYVQASSMSNFWLSGDKHRNPLVHPLQKMRLLPRLRMAFRSVTSSGEYNRVCWGPLQTRKDTITRMRPSYPPPGVVVHRS